MRQRGELRSDPGDLGLGGGELRGELRDGLALGATVLGLLGGGGPAGQGEICPRSSASTSGPSRIALQVQAVRRPAGQAVVRPRAKAQAGSEQAAAGRKSSKAKARGRRTSSAGAVGGAHLAVSLPHAGVGRSGGLLGGGGRAVEHRRQSCNWAGGERGSAAATQGRPSRGLRISSSEHRRQSRGGLLGGSRIGGAAPLEGGPGWGRLRPGRDRDGTGAGVVGRGCGSSEGPRRKQRTGAEVTRGAGVAVHLGGDGFPGDALTRRPGRWPVAPTEVRGDGPAGDEAELGSTGSTVSPSVSSSADRCHPQGHPGCPSWWEAVSAGPRPQRPATIRSPVPAGSRGCTRAM